MDLHEETGHGVEQLVAVAALALRQAHEEAPELERARQVARGDDREWSPLRVTRPTARTAGAPRSLQLAHDVVLRLPDLDGQLLERQDAAPTTMKRTVWRLAPTGRSTNWRSSRSQRRERHLPGQLEEVLAALAEAHRDAAGIELEVVVLGGQERRVGERVLDVIRSRGAGVASLRLAALGLAAASMAASLGLPPGPRVQLPGCPTMAARRACADAARSAPAPSSWARPGRAVDARWTSA